MLLDALAMGTPVVITSRRSVAEYAMETDTVTTVSVRDATGLRMALDAAMGVSRDHPRESYGGAYPTAPSPDAGMGSSRTRGSTHPGNGRPRSTADFAAGVAAVFREVA